MRSDWRVIIGPDFEACGGRKEMICLASRALLPVGDCRHILGLLVQGWPNAKVARDVQEAWESGLPGGGSGRLKRFRGAGSLWDHSSDHVREPR